MGINDILYYLLAFYASVAVAVGFGAAAIILFDLEVPEIGRRAFQSVWVVFPSTVAAGGLLWLAETLFG